MSRHLRDRSRRLERQGRVASPGCAARRSRTSSSAWCRPATAPQDERAARCSAGWSSELRLEHDTAYIGVYGDQVFIHVLEFGFKNLRRAELAKAVGAELEGVVPVDLEDMVYAFEPLPPAPPAQAIRARRGVRGRVAAPTDGHAGADLLDAQASAPRS